jgi:hypothetical protein
LLINLKTGEMNTEKQSLREMTDLIKGNSKTNRDLEFPLSIK